MCSGVELLAAASALMQGFSTLQQGRQAQKMANYEAKQAEANAAAERGAAAVRADKIRKMGRMQRSSARAALAASGANVGEGTALVIDQQIGRDAEEDALTEIMTGGRRADALNTQAELSRISGRNARSASYLGAAGSAFATGYDLKNAADRREETRSVLASGYQAAHGWKKVPVDDPFKDWKPTTPIGNLEW